MNTTQIVTTLVRLTEEGFGDDKQAKIYKVTHLDETVSFSVSLFESDQLKSCQGDYISYGYVMKAAIEWIDNSEFFL